MAIVIAIICYILINDASTSGENIIPTFERMSNSLPLSGKEYFFIQNAHPL